MPIHDNVSTKKRNRHEKKGDHQKKQIIPTNRRRSSISLSDLPPNILVEILTRLPLRTLFVARSVCKTLGFLSTPNPHFINLHSSNAPQITVFQFREFMRQSPLIHMADQFKSFKKSQLKPFFQLPKTDETVEHYNKLYVLVNSCNGLLYFRQIVPDYLSLVCNPVTNEYIIIPLVDPEMRLHSQTLSLFLGFSPVSYQYKVLSILRPRKRNAAGPIEVAAQVFVIGSDSWRVIHIDDTLLHRRNFIWDLCRAQHVNGLMYWLDGLWRPGQAAIISFDFEGEKFREVTLPPELQYEEFMTKYEKSIGVLGGCLCLICNNYDAYRVDLWVMRKCGNQQSWTKEFVFDTLTLGRRGRPVYGPFKPLQFFGNGEILMQWGRNNLICYDPKTETLRYFRFRRSDSNHKVVALTPSFVSLKDALKVEKVLTLSRLRGDERSYDNGKKRRKHTQVINTS